MFWPPRGTLKPNGICSADRHALAIHLLAVQPDRDVRRRAGGCAVVGDPVVDGLALADDAEARRAHDLDAPVRLSRMAGDESMHRCLEAERIGVRRDVVHFAVGDQDRSGDTGRRNVLKRGGEGREKLRRGRVAVRVVPRIRRRGPRTADSARASSSPRRAPCRSRSCARPTSGSRCGRRRPRRRSSAGRAARGRAPDWRAPARGRRGPARGPARRARGAGARSPRGWRRDRQGWQ